MHPLHFVALALVLFASGVGAAADDLRVLPERINGVPASELLTTHLLEAADAALAKRRAAYDALKTPEQISAYQQSLRGFFRQQLGEFPERSPLNAEVTGRVLREGFTVEKILFESRPKHFVTGALFLPDAKNFKPPYPAVLVVCGHSANGKANDGYQRATALLALNGMAGFIIDPIGQGERVQLLTDDGKPQIPNSTDEHSLLGHGSVLLGRNTASFEVWDGMRAIDYLESRKDLDASKGVGCMGNSGGGTQTAYLMALDDRIACASPSCYITGFEKLLHTIGPQDAEQNIAGQVVFGMDHADYLLMRAPKPTLMCVATNDYFNIDGAWDAFRQAKRVYTRLGHGERVELAEFDGPHGWSQPLREAAVQWMDRWLRGEDKVVREPEIDVLTDAEIQVTPRGQVLLLEGAMSAFEINMDENKRLAAQRTAFWTETPRAEALRRVREIAGIAPREKLRSVGELRQVFGGRELFTCHSFARAGGFPLPMVRFMPGGEVAERRPLLYISEKGWAQARKDGTIGKLVDGGRIVVAVDVSGAGETASTKGQWYNARFGSEGRNATTAYLLGKSLLGIRAEDIIAAADFAAAEFGAKDDRQVDLIAVGEIGPAALHAASVEPELFHAVRLERSLASYTGLVETPVTQGQWVQVVHGALQVYDLPDLARSLGDKLEVIEPLDAEGRPVAQDAP